MLIKREVSDGVIAPGYTQEALEILSQKKKGNYNVIQIDADYVPAPLEHKEVFGVTFEQGRQELPIDDELLSNVVTAKKELSEEAKRDLKISLITLKYTQSNSVCFVKDGQAIGIGAGQQSRVHCTRLAGQKADNWFLRQSPKVMNLPFKDDIKRAERDNAIDVYIGEEYMDVLADGAWEKVFTEKPEVFTREEKRQWLDKMTGVTLGSDAFFPFSDNIERAHKSGVQYIAQPGGSVRDDLVIETCDKYGMAMAFTGIRLFHHYKNNKKTNCRVPVVGFRQFAVKNTASIFLFTVSKTNRSSVGENLGSRGSDRICGVGYSDHRVRSHFFGTGDQAVCGDHAGLLHHLAIRGELSAYQCL